MKADPELGKSRWHLKNTWITCGQNQSRIESFFAAKQEIPHKEPFELKAEEQAALSRLSPVFDVTSNGTNVTVEMIERK